MGEVKPVMIRSMARACQVLQLLWQHEEIFKGLNAAYADDRGWERTGNEAKMWGIFYYKIVILPKNWPIR